MIVHAPHRSPLQQRLVSGSLLAGAIIALVALDGWLAGVEPPPRWMLGGVNLGHWLYHGALVTLTMLVLTLLAVRELLRLARHLGYRPLRFETYVFAAGLIVGPYVSYNVRDTAAIYDESLGMLWLAVALGYAFWAHAVRRGTERVIQNVAVTLFFIFFAGGLGGYLTKLRMEVGGPQGATVLLFSIFLVKMTDVGAFFTGLLIGRHKFVPWLSPKKTWEGVIGGIAVAVACAAGVGNSLHHHGWIHLGEGSFAGGWGLALFGFVMALFSIAGDLAESLLKRDAAVKDSSNMIPGMGGVLDILDSPLLAAPAAWYYWTRLAHL